MARLWDIAFARWTHTLWKTLVDRNSIVFLSVRNSSTGSQLYDWLLRSELGWLEPSRSIITSHDWITHQSVWWQTLVDQNSIGLLVGRKFLDRIIALRSITSIGAWLTRTFLFGHHILRLDHTPIGSSTTTWVLALCCVYVYFFLSLCEVSFTFCTLWFLFIFITLKFLKFWFVLLWNLDTYPLLFEIIS